MDYIQFKIDAFNQTLANYQQEQANAFVKRLDDKNDLDSENELIDTEINLQDDEQVSQETQDKIQKKLKQFRFAKLSKINQKKSRRYHLHHHKRVKNQKKLLGQNFRFQENGKIPKHATGSEYIYNHKYHIEFNKQIKFLNQKFDEQIKEFFLLKQLFESQIKLINKLNEKIIKQNFEANILNFYSQNLIDVPTEFKQWIQSKDQTKKNPVYCNFIQNHKCDEQRDINWLPIEVLQNQIDIQLKKLNKN